MTILDKISKKRTYEVSFDPPEVLIMSGLPGSGKSTLIQQMKNNGWGVKVCSADHFFENLITGKYEFKPNLIGEAHKECMKNFLSTLQLWNEGRATGLDYIVVDNTNTQLWEITPYTSVAAALGFKFRIIRFMVDPEICAARNLHGVPADKVKEMAERANKLNLPRYWNVEVVK